MKTSRVIVVAAMIVAAVGCEEGKTDPCPQIKAGGGIIRPVVTTGTAPAPSGGALVVGTYNLSTLDVVLSESPSEEGKVRCEALTEATQQDTIRITPSSATEGTLVSLSVADDGNGTTSDRRSSGSYVSAGSVLTISVSGNVCATSLVPQADGGFTETRMVENQEPVPQSSPYTSTDSTLAFFVTLAFGGSTDCVVVQTYTKQ